jgi:spore maturation protein CgeB
VSARPRIAMFGSSLVSAYWNGAATYYRGVLAELAARGYDIDFYEPDAFERQAHRDIPDPPWARVHVYLPTPEDACRCLEHASAADIVVKASGVGVLDEFLEAEVARLDGDRLRVFWDVDAPATLERIAGNARDPFRAHLPDYDVVLTYGGGDAVVRAYRALGARDCAPVYNAVDPVTHRPVPPDARFAGDLGVLGNRLPDREARVREFFLEPARRMPARSFLLGGSGWNQDIELPPSVRAIGHVYTRDHNAFNCTPRTVINVNRDSMARFGFSPPTRVFEAAGAAACLLCDAWEGLETFLEPGREVLVVRSGAEVDETLDRLDATRAREIGAAARRRVLAEHTYAQRANFVARMFGSWMHTPARPRTKFAAHA